MRKFSRTVQVDVRAISATNADLRAEIDAGRFRADLLFHLKTVEIHLPTLRERREDIPALAAFFLSRHLQRYRKRLAELQHKPLDSGASAMIANQAMELTAKSPHLWNWFSQGGPAHIAQLDLSGDGSDSFSCTGRTIPE